MTTDYQTNASAIDQKVTDTASTVTMLRSSCGKALVKSFNGESWKSYDNEKYFLAREEKVDTPESWCYLLKSVASDSDVALVRGNVLSEQQRPEFYTDANGKQSRTTLKNGAVARCNDVIEDAPRNWVLFDVDAFEPFLYKATEPGAIQEWIAAALPAEFQNTRFVYQFSNTAGFKGNLLKCHVFFLLKTPYTCNELRQWARAKGLDVDPISFKQAQLIYTGNPRLAKGVADPVPQRIGISYEGKRDSVPLVIDSAVLAQAHERDANRGPGLTDAREKPGYIGAFCRAHEPDELVDGLLSEYFEWLDYDTGKLNYLAGASGATRGAFLSNDRQRITNMHGSAGFKQHSPLNSFDAVRYYALGGIDSDEADFDANRDDSYHRIIDLCKGDARVQAEMGKVEVKAAEDYFKTNPLPAANDDEDDRPKTQRFPLAMIGDLLANIKPPSWLVKGMIENDSLGVLFGAPGSGKSFLAMDIAASVATGTDWHGHKVDKGLVVYIAGEGHNGVAKRLKAWSIARDVSLEDAPLAVSRASANLTNAATTKDVMAAITAAEAATGLSPKLVVVDTLARNFGSLNEDSAQDMGAFTGNLDRIRNRWGCCVLTVHHTGKNDANGPRGSSALNGAMDATYRVKKEGPNITLSNEKMKEADNPEPIGFKLEDRIDLGFLDEDGQIVTSAAVKLHLGLINEDILQSLPSTEAGKKSLAALDEITTQESPTVSSSDWFSRAKRNDIPKTTFYHAKEVLIREGFVQEDNSQVTRIYPESFSGDE